MEKETVLEMEADAQCLDLDIVGDNNLVDTCGSWHLACIVDTQQEDKLAVLEVKYTLAEGKQGSHFSVLC